MGKVVTLEEFLDRCIKTHGDRYDYSKTYLDGLLCKTIVTCKIHGDFSVRANAHANGANCKKCGSESASKIRRHLDIDIIEKAKYIWGNQFDYSEMNFKGMRHPCKIKCNICGSYFYQKMDKHINAKQNGCPNCSSHITWTRTSWVNHCENKNQFEPCVYIVRLFNDSESFIKIGITSNTIFSRMKKIPYQYEVLKEIKGSPYSIYNKENELHRKFVKSKYVPIIPFGGQTECFSIDILPLIKDL